jgi:type IV pilus modification protein PilV
VARPPIEQRGFTVIEVLAAALVMAAAVIGIAAIYADQAQTHTEAQLHTRAAELADKIAARIRATQEGRSGFATTIGIVCSPKAKPKLAHDVAALEAACWEDEVEQTLPSGLGSISRDLSTTPPAYVVAVSWSAPESGAASYVVRVGPEE